MFLRLTYDFRFTNNYGKKRTLKQSIKLSKKIWLNND